jgi:hypothetical protein
MNAYTYWEQGRSLASGQIVSMIPIDPSSTASSLGGITLGPEGLALSAIAQFGIWMEMRKMNKLREAEFEERRHSWITEITNQWIDEHSQTHGILRDVTEAVGRECEKMGEKVCDNDKVDVPQTVVLRLKRLAEFLEWNYAVVAFGNNQIVEASGSDENWLLNPDASSEGIAMQFLSEAATEHRGSWWKGLLKSVAGLPLFLIPGIGPIAGGSAVGYGIGEMIGRARFSDADLEILHDKLPLLQFGIAASLLESASQQMHYLLNAQEFKKPMRFLAVETSPNEVSFLLDRITPTKTWRPQELKPIPVPS